ncbi:MAG: hypothetical protein ACXVVK_20475, partial [Solirubrobacteraceae bacterium]
MSRLRPTVIALLAMAAAGCGSTSRLQASSLHGPGSLGGCTDTWTGAAGDHDYTNPANWSGGRAPGDGDFGCIRPGSLVNVNRRPLERASGLVIEGTLCANVDAFALAANIYNGARPRAAPPAPAAWHDRRGAALPAGDAGVVPGIGSGPRDAERSGRPPPPPPQRRPPP